MCSGRSHTYVRTINHLASVLRCFCTQPVLTVMVSEMLVDWLKHAFITKFNHIRPSVYERYKDVLCRDLASGSAVGRRGARKVSFPPPPPCPTDETPLMPWIAQHTYVDQSPLVARRLGFASLPLAVLSVLIGSQSVALLISMHTDDFPPWKRPVTDLSENELINIAKWAALSILAWFW